MSVSLCIAYRVASRRAAQPACRSSIRCAAWSPSHLSSSSFSPPLLLVPLSSPSVGLATNSNPTSTVNPRPDALDSTQLLSRRPSKGLTEVESRGSVLDLYRKICRLLPQVLKAYELQGEDSYHRALRNLRFYFENHSQLKDSHVIEVLRHKAEMEIEEAMLMSHQQPHNQLTLTHSLTHIPAHCTHTLTHSLTRCVLCCVGASQVQD